VQPNKNYIKIKEKLVDELIPYENNAKLHPQKQIDQIINSINKFGFNDPIGIDENGMILTGHGRVIACKQMGMKTVPTVRLDHMTNQEKKAYILAHNKLTMNTDFDIEVLNSELEELGDFEMEEFGFELEELDIEEELEINDTIDNPELEAGNCITQSGDIWEINDRHTLFCGDSKIKENIDKLLGADKFNIGLVFTDPPYNYKKFGSGGSLGKKFIDVKENIKEIINFEPEEFLSRLNEVFVDTMNAYIFCNTNLVPDYCNWAKENGYNFNILTWHKLSFIPANQGHHFPDTEYLIYISKNHTFNTGLNNVNYGKYWVINNEKHIDHPTIKPVEIIRDELLISSNQDDIILDFFGGSGTTLMVAEALSRKCKMIEMSPAYCDVILKRFLSAYNIHKITLNGKQINILDKFGGNDVE